jgi:hypothetical protein
MTVASISDTAQSIVLIVISVTGASRNEAGCARALVALRHQTQPVNCFTDATIFRVFLSIVPATLEAPQRAFLRGGTTTAPTGLCARASGRRPPFFLSLLGFKVLRQRLPGRKRSILRSSARTPFRR